MLISSSCISDNLNNDLLQLPPLATPLFVFSLPSVLLDIVLADKAAASNINDMGFPRFSFFDSLSAPCANAFVVLAVVPDAFKTFDVGWVERGVVPGGLLSVGLVLVLVLGI